MKVYVDTWIYVTEKYENMGFIELYKGILRYETGILPTIPNFIWIHPFGCVVTTGDYLLYRKISYKTRACVRKKGAHGPYSGKFPKDELYRETACDIIKRQIQI